MKKLLFTIALLLASTMSFAQTGDDVINEFKEMKNVEFVNASKSMISMMISKVNNPMISDLAKNIESVNVLSMDECSDKMKKDVSERVNNLKGKGYEEMLRAKDNDQNVLILTKMNGEDIKELLLLTVEDNENCLIQIKGNIKKEDIDKIMGMVGKK